MSGSLLRFLLIMMVYIVAVPWPLATAQEGVSGTATSSADKGQPSPNSPKPKLKQATPSEKKEANQTRTTNENENVGTKSDRIDVREKAASEKDRLADAETIPNDLRLVAMIRSHTAALNHANKTGNYSVFRELASTSFQSANSTARLSSIFSKLRSRNLDLSAALVLDPKLIRPPNIDGKSRLRLTGFFPSKPERIDFDMIFEQSGGDWKLFGIALDTTRPEPSAKKRRTTKPAPKTEVLTPE